MKNLILILFFPFLLFSQETQQLPSFIGSQNVVTYFGIGYKAFKYNESQSTQGPLVNISVLMFENATPDITIKFAGQINISASRHYFPLTNKTHLFLHNEGGIGLTDSRRIYGLLNLGYLFDTAKKSQNNSFTLGMEVGVHMIQAKQITVSVAGKIGTTLNKIKGTSISSSFYGGGVIKVGYKLVNQL